MNQAEQLTSAHFRAYQALHTPIWICAAQPVQLTWANNAALALGHAAVLNDALAEPVDTGAIAEQRVLQYVEQFQAGNPTPDLADLYVDGQWCSLKFQSSYCSTAEGSSAVLVEGVLTRHPTESTLLASHRLFKAGPTVMFRWRVSDGWAVEEVSPNVYEQFGYLPEALIQGRVRYADLIHPDDMAQVWREVQDYSAAKVPWFEQSYRLHHADGSYRWLYDFTTVVRNAQGQITHYLGYVQDVSDRKRSEEERKQIEAALRLSETAKQAMLEAIPDMLVCINREGFFHDLIAGESIKLWRPTEPNWQQSVYQEMPHDLAVKRMQYITMALDTGQIQCYSQTIEVDGELRHEEARIVPMSADEVLVMVRDMTDYVRAEQALQESERRFHAIFDHMYQFIGLLAPDGMVLEANQTALDFGGLQRADVVGRFFWELGCWQVSPKIPVQLREAIAQAAEGKFVRYEVDVQGRGGQMITIDFSLRPIFDAAGNVVLLIPEGRNITDRKQMEVQIQQQASRDRLIGSIGQHIRQSLNLSEILDTTVLDLREAFQSDRVLICRLDSRTVTANTIGRVIAESYSGNYGSLLGQSIELSNMLKPCGLESFTGEPVCAITDVGKAGLPQPCVHFLQTNQVRAMLLQPIVRNDELWGLLVVHQCSGPRIWNAAEMELLTQVSYQVAIAIQQSELYQQLLQVNRELQHIATHDKLTGLPNRRYFDEYLQKEWLRLTRERSLLSLILCDIDHFKAYNDTYGHLAGDTCLAQVALAIQRAVYRPADVVARYGGEEFAIILPNTDRAGAVKVAQHIQQHLAELAIPHLTSPSSTQITISMGIATAQPMLKIPFQFIIDRADEALYRMKKTGRNGYELAP